MAFESFYGGRQGASFVIVYRFDAIDTDKLKKTFLAIADGPDASGKYIYWYDDENNKFIERNSANYTEYSWNEVTLDGSTVNIKNISDSSIGTQELSRTEATVPYKGAYYAITDDVVGTDGLHTYLYNSTENKFIERNVTNYADYFWNYVVLDGSSVRTADSITGEISEKNLPEKAAEGMVQCFKQGGDSTDIVNYGEYVIIDAPNKNDPDNGKVYRRGLFYNDKDKLYGAEYIGQIIGPQGQATEIAIDHEQYIKTLPGSHSGEYDVDHKDLIPAMEIDGEIPPQYGNEIIYVGSYSGSISTFFNNKMAEGSLQTAVYKVFNLETHQCEYYGIQYFDDGAVPYYTLEELSHIINDTMTYSWVTLRDAYGNIQTALIGFSIPYFMFDIYGRRVSAYYNIDPNTGKKLDVNLLERLDDGSHPFYENLELKIPDGIKGNSVEDFVAVYTYTKPEVMIYEDPECTIEIGAYQNEFLLKFDDNPNPDAYSFYVKDNNLGIQGYVRNLPDNLTKSVLRYTEIDYSKKEEGDKTYKQASKYNVIKNTELKPNGDLYIDYTYDGLTKVGRIRLEKSTLGIICEVDDESHLKDDIGISIPPEYIIYAEEERAAGHSYIFDPSIGKDDKYIGWLVAVKSENPEEDPNSSVWGYDYIDNIWFPLSTVDLGATFIISDDEPANLREKSTWAVAEVRKSARDKTDI